MVQMMDLLRDYKDSISIIISCVSLFISLVVFAFNIKSSYNPKIKIIPWDSHLSGTLWREFPDGPTSLIENFFNTRIYTDHSKEPPAYLYALFVVLYFILIIPSAIYYWIFMGRTYGVAYTQNIDGFLIVWLRIMNVSKYPITIYNAEYKKNIFRREILKKFPINTTGIDLIVPRSERIHVPNEELQKLPIKISPFEYTCGYYAFDYADFSSSIEKLEKFKGHKRISLIFYTSGKKYKKSIKVYNLNSLDNSSINYHKDDKYGYY